MKHEHDDATLARLFELVGRRPEPPAEASAKAYSAAHAAWQAKIRQRRTRTRWRWAATAAGLMLATVFSQQWLSPGPAPTVVATVQAGQGTIQGRQTPIARGATLVAGDALVAQTDVLLDLGGITAEVSSGTRLHLIDPERLELLAGALMLETTDSRAITIETPYGAVRNVGTQFRVALGEQALVLEVREGQVSVAGPDGEVRAEAGERWQITDNDTQRSLVSPFASTWGEWDSVSLRAVLRWAALDTQRELAFATPPLEARADAIRFHGGLPVMSAEDTLLAVLQTTDLKANLSRPGILLIDAVHPHSTP